MSVGPQESRSTRPSIVDLSLQASFSGEANGANPGFYSIRFLSRFETGTEPRPLEVEARTRPDDKHYDYEFACFCVELTTF